MTSIRRANNFYLPAGILHFAGYTLVREHHRRPPHDRGSDGTGCRHDFLAGSYLLGEVACPSAGGRLLLYSFRRLGCPRFSPRVITPGSNSDAPRSAQDFATTHWSVVLRAAKDGDSQAAALEELCSNYWRPIYAYIRRRGHPPEDAQDLTQGFFHRLLEKGWLTDIDPDRARFRSFVLTMVSRFLANEFHRETSQKRGGGRFHFSIQDADLENQLAADASTSSPEQDFDRRWALTVLDRAIARLRQESSPAHRAIHFERLSPFLSREADAGDYAALAAELGLTAGGVAVSVHRLRHRYRDLVREEIAETLSHPSDVDEEMRHLFAALRGSPL